MVFIISRGNKHKEVKFKVIFCCDKLKYITLSLLQVENTANYSSVMVFKSEKVMGTGLNHKIIIKADILGEKCLLRLVFKSGLHRNGS